MRTDIKRNPIRFTLFAAALLASALFARPAHAQSGITGKFTLSYETHWGRAVLPAGEYQLTFVRNNEGSMLLIQDAKSRRAVAFEPANVREDSREAGSALLIGTRGKQHVVYSLTIADLGESFVYQRPAAHNRELEEARETQAVPVFVAMR